MSKPTIDFKPLTEVELWAVYDKERNILVTGHKKNFYYSKAACTVAIGHKVRHNTRPSNEWYERHSELIQSDYKLFWHKEKAERKKIADTYKERYVPIKITAVEYPKVL